MAAKTNGGVGDGIKLRKQRVSLVEDTPEEREETMDMFMGAMSANGRQRVMEAIDKVDPRFRRLGPGLVINSWILGKYVLFITLVARLDRTRCSRRAPDVGVFNLVGSDVPGMWEKKMKQKWTRRKFLSKGRIIVVWHG